MFKSLREHNDIFFNSALSNEEESYFDDFCKEENTSILTYPILTKIFSFVEFPYLVNCLLLNKTIFRVIRNKDEIFINLLNSLRISRVIKVPKKGVYEYLKKIQKYLYRHNNIDIDDLNIKLLSEFKNDMETKFNVERNEGFCFYGMKKKFSLTKRNLKNWSYCFISFDEHEEKLDVFKTKKKNDLIQSYKLDNNLFYSADIRKGRALTYRVLLLNDSNLYVSFNSIKDYINFKNVLVNDFNCKFEGSYTKYFSGLNKRVESWTFADISQWLKLLAIPSNVISLFEFQLNNSKGDILLSLDELSLKNIGVTDKEILKKLLFEINQLKIYKNYVIDRNKVIKKLSLIDDNHEKLSFNRDEIDHLYDNFFFWHKHLLTNSKICWSFEKKMEIKICVNDDLRVGICVDNLYLEWNKTELIIPKIINEDNEKDYLMFDVGFVEFDRELFSYKLAKLVTFWNINCKYKEKIDLNINCESVNYNGEEFVEQILGIFELSKRPFNQYQTLDDIFYSCMWVNGKLNKMSISLSDSFFKFLGFDQNNVMILKTQYFPSHKDLDKFVQLLLKYQSKKNISKNYPNEWKILKFYDKIFWKRYNENKSDSVNKPLQSGKLLKKKECNCPFIIS